ncbi:MAG: pentapeptide repeat-containing protein [Thermosynechococcaceae cyanobacterium]
MSYCLNPACTNPNNPPEREDCQACGTQLLLRDRYRSTRILGRGGFATTFLATDESLPGEPTCVIKQLRPVLTAEHILEMSRELFQREATTLGKIGNHPHLPRLLDYFELGNDFYLVQEYVSGATLQQDVRRSGPFDEGRVKTVLTEVLPLLDYLHQQKVIHRDVKPANIIQRTIDSKFVLIDFGAVKDQVSQSVLANASADDTFTTFAVGTPGFAPPEQMAMRPVYASDIYSLGVTCLYLLTGKSPKDLNYDPTTGELSWQDLVSLTPGFKTVLTTMMAVSLRDRYQSAKHVLQALERMNQPVPTRPSLSTAPTAQRSPLQAPPSMTAPRNQRNLGTPPQRGAITQGRDRSDSPSARRASQIRSQQRRLNDPLSESFGTLSQGSSARRRSSSEPEKSQESGRSKAKVTPNGLKHAYSRGQKDFSNRDLRDLDLRKFALPNISFHEAKLQGVNFKGAELYKANFGRATLTKAILRDANLTEAYLSYSDLEGADLRGANLIDAHLTNANLRGANLCGANLTGASVSMAQLAFAQVNWLTIMPNGKRGKKGLR